MSEINTSDLLKQASKFLRLSQDNFQSIKEVIEKLFPPGSGMFAQSVSLIGKEVKVVIHLDPSAATQTNRSQLQEQVSQVVRQIDPSLTVSLTIDMSSEGKIASILRKHKYAQDNSPAVRAAIEAVLINIPQSKLLDLKIAGNQVDAEIQVPQQHSFTASQLGNTLTQAVQSVAPGFKVVPILSFAMPARK